MLLVLAHHSDSKASVLHLVFERLSPSGVGATIVSSPPSARCAASSSPPCSGSPRLSRLFFAPLPNELKAVGRSQSKPVGRLMHTIKQKTWEPQKEATGETPTQHNTTQEEPEAPRRLPGEYLRVKRKGVKHYARSLSTLIFALLPKIIHSCTRLNDCQQGPPSDHL